ncbi:MAG: NUDIX hydrolase [Patescibacteria group bacterium]
MKTNIPNKIYNQKRAKEKCVNVVILSSQGKIFILKRSSQEPSYPNLWDLPGGKVKNGETLQEATKRETKEESGLDVELRRNYFYVYNCPDKKFNIYGFKARSINGDVLLSEEHTEFKWISKDNWENLEYTPSVTATIKEFL